MSVCDRTRRAVACGDDLSSSADHLQRCAACAAFAADALRLREAARGLPRPVAQVTHRPARAVRSVWTPAVVAAAAVVVAVVVSLALVTRPPRGPMAKSPPPPSESVRQVDLLASLSQAQQVWSRGKGSSWLDLTATTTGGSQRDDPLSGLRAADLLLPDRANPTSARRNR